MAEKKNELFENAWNLYSRPVLRKAMQEKLPYVAKLFSSGNRAQAEQEFNAALFSSTYGTNPFKNELAWAAAGTIPIKKDVVNAVDEKGFLNDITSGKNISMDKAAKEFFVANPESANDAENFYAKVESFKKQGYTDDESKMYAMPVETFKGLSKAIDSKAQYKWAGKDNKVHSVIEDFHDRRTTPKEDEIVTGDLVEKQDADKLMLAKMFGGNTSEVVGDNTNLNTLEEYAKDLGFVDSDALIEYLAKSYDRRKILRDQEDDRLFTAVGKKYFAPTVNEKWNEGVPSTTADKVHDAVLAGLEFSPQGKALGAVGRGAKTILPKVKAVAETEKILSSPLSKYIAINAALPVESAVMDAVLYDKDIDPFSVGARTIANSTLDAGAVATARALGRVPLLSGLFENPGRFLESKIDVAKNLEKRAYEIALENEAGQAAHNLMLRLNPDFRADPKFAYRSLSKNKNFNRKFPLSEESFNRVFNDAWKTAKFSGAGEVPTAKPSLKIALKSLDSYKKSKDFKTALQAAAWEKSGYKGGNILNELRDDPYKFRINLENADAEKYGALMNLYNDYITKKKGLDNIRKQIKFEGLPYVMRTWKNVSGTNGIYGSVLDRAMNLPALKKDDERKK